MLGLPFHSESVIDGDTGSLQKRYLEYMDGARLYLENENDKDNTLQQIKTHFCHFVRKLIGSFSCNYPANFLCFLTIDSEIVRNV